MKKTILGLLLFSFVGCQDSWPYSLRKDLDQLEARMVRIQVEREEAEKRREAEDRKDLDQFKAEIARLQAEREKPEEKEFEIVRYSGVGTFLLEKRSGQVWRYIEMVNLEGTPEAWLLMRRLDSAEEASQWYEAARRLDEKAKAAAR